MKKLLLSALLLLFCISTYAQKSYVTVICRYSDDIAYLSGDIPASMDDRYSGADFGKSGYYAYFWIGDLLNQLAGQGFTVELMNTITAGTSTSSTLYLLSKPASGSTTTHAIEKVKAGNTEPATEVARYNLQGIPVQAGEKGIQIIVYSNYTTKTVIVE